MEGLLDTYGREMLTVWIPLDHTITDDDVASARRIGELFRKNVAPTIALHTALETSVKAVGIMVTGRDAEQTLEQIRPFFKQHCPRGTYVTRRRLPGKNEDRSRMANWPQPKPLFEDDVIALDW